MVKGPSGHAERIDATVEHILGISIVPHYEVLRLSGSGLCISINCLQQLLFGFQAFLDRQNIT